MSPRWERVLLLLGFAALFFMGWCARPALSDDSLEERVQTRLRALDQALRRGPEGDSEARFGERIDILTNSVTTAGAGSAMFVYRALKDPRLLVTTRATLVDHLVNARPYDADATAAELHAVVEDPFQPAAFRNGTALRLADLPGARGASIAACAKLMHDTKGGYGAIALSLLNPSKLPPDLAPVLRLGLSHEDEKARQGALILVRKLGPAAKPFERDVRRALIDERLMVRHAAEQALAAINAPPSPPR